MFTLVRYLSVIFASRFLLVAAGVTMFVGILDVMANGDEIVDAASGDANALFRYALLRLPEIISQVTPFCVLISALLTLAQLTRHSELIALRSFGISQFAIFIGLVPVALLVVAGLMFVNEGLIPKSVAALRLWGIGEYGKGMSALGISEGVRWMRKDDNVLRVTIEERPDGRIGNILVFERNDRGELLRRIEAQSADPANWILFDVTLLDVATNETTFIEKAVWEARFRPTRLLPSITHPREMPLPDVILAVENEGFGLRPPFLYETWFHKKLAAPAVVLLMILLPIPLAHRFQRHRGILSMLVMGIALGFCFFIFDGFALAMGEAGLLPPILAAWVPTAVLALVAQGMMYQIEGA